MHWALLGVIALALVVLAYRYPRLAISLLVALIFLGLGGYWLQSKQQPGEAQISPEDVAFTAISIDPGYAGSWNLLARAHTVPVCGGSKIGVTDRNVCLLAYCPVSRFHSMRHHG